MKEISETGYWNAETAHIHHVHCTELSKWICEFLKDEKETIIYDFGCGIGNYIKDLYENDFEAVFGFEAKKGYSVPDSTQGAGSESWGRSRNKLIAFGSTGRVDKPTTIFVLGLIGLVGFPNWKCKETWGSVCLKVIRR